jgi:hypothetical protein
MTDVDSIPSSIPGFRGLPRKPLFYNAALRINDHRSSPPQSLIPRCSKDLKIMKITSLLLVSMSALVLVAAAEPAQRPGGPGRMLMSYEVEVLTLAPDDRAAVAAWTELAALGYHVVATVAKPDGATVLYLERIGAPGALRVPAVLNTDPAAVEALRARVLEQQQARLPVGQPPMPAPAPPVAK